ncbi:hypothetical protein NDU88_005459 [Pleurodeles waltl]|uniref:Uncharacterized protein n=1 Tax=Pleurodeles waltl TaxID=8319 RepID=A0AAV7MAJ5_PLEWA|nr:hypothetical protein NDU88_005459 [Pleurodeles waltl]
MTYTDYLTLSSVLLGIFDPDFRLLDVTSIQRRPRDQARVPAWLFSGGQTSSRYAPEHGLEYLERKLTDHSPLMFMLTWGKERAGIPK